jgi:myo-inositol-1(or 4)-monophosphatase
MSSETGAGVGAAQASAHRGDSSRFRENTLPAIRSAIEAGAHFVEIDVRLTVDGAVVVVHDETLQRLWGVPEAIADVTLAEVRAIGAPDERPPLLREVAELFDGAAATLLIDMTDAAFAAPAHRAVAGLAVNVAWCGDLGAMRVIRDLDADARIWVPWERLTAPTAADLLELRPERVNVPYLLAHRDFVAAVHELGCRVTAWTVDDEPAMRWVLRNGVDTVTTNRLARLQRIIDGSDDGGAAEHDGVAEAYGVDIDAAFAVARGLAEWAIEYSGSTDPGVISTKADPADLVTEVDVAVERRVREVIAANFPDHDFVGEEMGGAARLGRPCWYLDPVDGTTNFANRVPWNAFSLALAVDRTPLVGVVADPWRGDVFAAVRGGGATLNGRPLSVPERAEADGDPLAGSIVSTELAAHVPWTGMVPMLTRLGARFCTMRIMGSGTMTLVGVAAGRGAGAVIGSFGSVDHLAATIIVQEAGGVVLGSDGEPTLFPESGGILAAAPWAAEELYELWQESVTEDALE